MKKKTTKKKPLGATPRRSSVQVPSTPVTGKPLNAVWIATWLLEVESHLTMARARMLRRDQVGFIEHALAARRTLGTLLSEVLAVGEATGEYFMVATETQPVSEASGSLRSEAP